VEDFKKYKSDRYPDLQVEVRYYETDTLMEVFALSHLAGNSPDLLWTVDDHSYHLAEADIILPLDELVDLSLYRSQMLLGLSHGGQTYGVPVNGGNHLMLYYNKELVPQPPQTTDELIALGKELILRDRYALVFTQTEPYWLIPWLGGFGGQVFAEDGVTSTLNTEAMIKALQLLQDMKLEHGIMPQESGYGTSEKMFLEGRAAMLINGDWVLDEYHKSLGENLGVARIPMVSETGLWPAPYSSGKAILISKNKNQDSETMELLLDFIRFATNLKNQQDLVYYLNRLPGLKEIYEGNLLDDSQINEILTRSASQLSVAVPMPAVPQMRNNWDAMRPWMVKVLDGTATPLEAALGMQTQAEVFHAERN
jgi:arabinogalactan oligomer/maltooligosaccharide transport system substrate-binding protein